MLLPLLDTLSNSLKGEQEHWQILSDRIKRLTRAIMRAMTIKVPGSVYVHGWRGKLDAGKRRSV